MIYSKKGLSTIVTTLILVLLVLVAVGILWSPIKNLLDQSTDSFDQTECLTLDLDMKAQRTDSAQNSYDVTITRNDNGDIPVYVKLMAVNSTDSSSIVTPGDSWVFPEVHTLNDLENTVNATTVRVISYFVNEGTGDEIVCDDRDITVLPAPSP